MPINISGNIISSGVTDSNGVIKNYPNLVSGRHDTSVSTTTLYINTNSANACLYTGGTSLPTYTFGGTATLCDCTTINGANISGLSTGVTYYVSDAVYTRTFTKTATTTLTQSGTCTLCTPEISRYGLILWADAGRSFSYFDTTYYDCGYGCQYYASNPGCTNCNTVWLDMSTNYYRGTLINTPTFNYQKGGYLTTNGTNSYIDFGTNVMANAVDSYTMSVWASVPATGSTRYFAVRGRDGSGTGWSMALLVSAPSNVAQFAVVTTSGGATQFTANGTTLIQANTFYYFTGVWEAGNLVSVYLNGVSEGSTATTTTTLRSSTDGVIVGSISTSIFSNVNVAQLQIYERALSASEILQNFNADRQRYGV
jgi:hypothetical protein